MKKQLFILLFLICSFSPFARQTITGNSGNGQNGYLSGKSHSEGNPGISASPVETTLISSGLPNSNWETLE